MSWNFGILDMVKEKLGIVSNENDCESNEIEIAFTESSLGITVENIKNRPTISKVISGSVGHLKGLLIGDIIIRVSNFNIADFNDFSNVISSFPERPLVIRFQRPGAFYSSSGNTTGNKNQVLLSEEEKEERRKAMVQAAFDRDKYKNITTNSQKNNSKKSYPATSSSATSSNNVTSTTSSNDNNGHIENQEIAKLIESVKREEARVVQEMGYDPFKPHMSSQSQARSQISRVVHGEIATSSTSATTNDTNHTTTNNSSNITNFQNSNSNNNNSNNSFTTNSSVTVAGSPVVDFPISDTDTEQVELALSLLLSLPDPSECDAVLRTLLKILSSLYANPNDAKLRTIRVLNPGFQKKVVAFAGGMELLLAAGFYITEMKSDNTCSSSGNTNSNSAMEIEAAAATAKVEDDDKEESYLRHNCHVSHESMALLKYTLERVNEVLSLTYSQNKTSTSTYAISIEDSDVPKSSSSTSTVGSGKVLGYKNPPTSTSSGVASTDTKREAILKAAETRNNNSKASAKSKRK